MAARKYKEPQCSFTMKDGCVETDCSIHKKVTGTAMAGILGLSPFNTPFQQACSLLGVCREDLSGKPAIEIGKALEEKIIKYIGKRYPEYGDFKTAREIPEIEARKGDHDTWGSDFDDEIFGGHIDGKVVDKTGNQYVLEIKTTSNSRSWVNGVPEYYRLQVELYNHFLYKQDKAYVAVALVDGVTMNNVGDWEPNDDNVFLFQMPIDREAFAVVMSSIEEWYTEYILMGVTPPYDPENKGDVEMWKHLLAISSTDDNIQADIDRLEQVTESICASEANMKVLVDEREDLKKKIKDYMTTNKCDEMKTTSGKYAATLSETRKKTIDADLLREDGIDPEQYMVTKVTKTFSLKPVKEDKGDEEE